MELVIRSFNQLLKYPVYYYAINADGRLGLFQYDAEKEVHGKVSLIPFSLSQHINASKPDIS
jgi:hypothetical protein